MASPATPAPGTCARTPRSMSMTSPTGRKPVAGLVLVLVLPVVLSVTTWVNLARPSRDQDRADHGDRVLRGLDIVLTDSTGAEAGQRGLLVAGRDDEPAPSIAGRGAAPDDISTVATPTAADPVPRERLRQLRPLAQEVVAQVRATVGGRRAGSASTTGTTGSTVIVGGLVGLLAAARAATGAGRRDRRRRLTTRAEVGDTSRVPGPTATSVGLVGSPAIDHVADVIASHAQQTRLLALDVTIEAARGNAGAGSAVVAGEVGRVPQHTATAVALGARPAEHQDVTVGRTLTVIPVRATGYAAARSRAHGPTTALWHAVEVRRPDGGVDGPCALAVCGSLVRVSTEERWPVASRGVCPACATLAH